MIYTLYGKINMLCFAGGKEMCYKYIVSVIAISSVTLIELIALLNSINGVALSLSIACIAGLGGYNLKKVIGEKK